MAPETLPVTPKPPMKISFTLFSSSIAHCSRGPDCPPLSRPRLDPHEMVRQEPMAGRPGWPLPTQPTPGTGGRGVCRPGCSSATFPGNPPAALSCGRQSHWPLSGVRVRIGTTVPDLGQASQTPDPDLTTFLLLWPELKKKKKYK